MVYNCFECNKEIGGYYFIKSHYARLHDDKRDVCKCGYDFSFVFLLRMVALGVWAILRSVARSQISETASQMRLMTWLKI